MLAVRRDTQAAIKTIAFEAHESNRSEETQLSSHRPCAPTCPATHTGQVRRHPRCYHRMHRETFNYIHHVTAWRRIVIRTSKTLSRIKCSAIISILWAYAFAVRRNTHDRLHVGTCGHRVETFNYIHHVTALRTMVIRTSKSAPQTTIVKKHARTTACGNLRPQSWDIQLHTPRHCLA